MKQGKSFNYEGFARSEESLRTEERDRSQELGVGEVGTEDGEVKELEEGDGEQLIREIPEDHLYNVESSGPSIDHTLSNMRMAFGSEQSVRENSVKTLEKLEETLSDPESAKKEENSSIFEKKSFQDFSLKKFAELMHSKNMQEFQDTVHRTCRKFSKPEILLTEESARRKSATPKKVR